MEYLKVHGWENHQSLRSDVKGPGPYIKVYRTLIRHHRWLMLTDAQRGHLLAIWILAADKWGKIPNSPRLVQKATGLDEEPDLELFISLGILESVNDPCTDRDRPVNDPCPQGKYKARQIQGNTTPPTPPRGAGKSAPKKEDANKILEHLNETTGRRFRDTTNIEARLKGGASVEDCIAVIDYLWAEWGGKPEMVDFVDVITPFRKTKFRGYLDKARAGPARRAAAADKNEAVFNKFREESRHGS